jgi:DNA-directed RNA polymerase specialized sigma24 family protein
VSRRAPSVGVSEPRTGESRRRVAAALARSTVRERLVLALLLYERLTPGEVASALGCPVAEVERTYRLLLASLRVAMRRPVSGRPSRALARAALVLESRFRRAS